MLLMYRGVQNVPITVEWTEPMIQRLKDLVEEDKYPDVVIAAKMSEEFGTYFTKNMVTGKRYRLKVSPKMTREQAAGDREFRRKQRIKKAEGPKLKLVPTPRAPYVEKLKPLVKSVMQLKAHHCRWPIGELGSPDFGFCGRPKEKGDDNVQKQTSYCACHNKAKKYRGRDGLGSHDPSRRSYGSLI